eukprot:1942386-Rhodomonas_salina.1
MLPDTNVSGAKLLHNTSNWVWTQLQRHPPSSPTVTLAGSPPLHTNDAMKGFRSRLLLHFHPANEAKASSGGSSRPNFPHAMTH